MQDPMLDAALKLANRGWPVFPLRGKVPAASGGRGHKDATTDPDTILALWLAYPGSNVGVATGARSGLAVLDVDVKNGIDGKATLREIVARLGIEWTPTLCARTGSGGWHYYFAWREGLSIGANTFGPGLDLRGEGGYVVAPGSTGYAWANDLDIAPWPAHILCPVVPERPRRPDPAPQPAATAKHDKIATFRVKRELGRLEEMVEKGWEVPWNTTAASVAWNLARLELAPWNSYTNAEEDFIGNCPTDAGFQGVTLDRMISSALGSATPAELGELGPSVDDLLGAAPPLGDPVPRAAPPAAGPAAEGSDDDDDGTLVTHSSMANVFEARHSADFRFVAERDEWLGWNGVKWCPRALPDVIMAICQLASRLPEGTKPEVAQKKALLSAAGIRGIEFLCRAQPGLRVQEADLDAHAWQLNTPGGVVFLRKGVMEPPDPEQLHTRCTTYAPDFDATPVVWLTFLDATFGGDAGMIEYVQRLIGVSLIGSSNYPFMPFCVGAGANGKTTLLEVLKRILGDGDDGYALSAESNILLAGARERHSTEIARLSGARFVVMSELEAQDSFAEGQLKKLTGGERLSARRLYQDAFTFEPTHSLWLAGNHRPTVKSGEESFWRRLREIPFLHIVPEEKREAGLQYRLLEEGPAILAWTINGLALHLADGRLDVPDAVRAATAAYALSEDPVARFVAEQCERAPATSIRVCDFRQAFERWCRAEGEDDPPSSKAMTTRVNRLGFESAKSHGTRLYRGVRLTPAEEPTADDVQDDDFWR